MKFKLLHKEVRLLWILLLCLFSNFVATGQNPRQISGTVKDNAGVPVTGANVIIVGSSSGATSDFDGNYSFSASIEGAQTIQVSYLGYETQEKAVTLDGSPITLNFVLIEGGNSLDEVVLTASAKFFLLRNPPRIEVNISVIELSDTSGTQTMWKKRRKRGVT